MKMRTFKIAFSMVGCVLALAVLPSKADTMYTLGVGNSALTGDPGPFGFVDVALSGNTATITFTANAVGGFQYLFGDGGTVGVNVNGSYTLGTVTEYNSFTGFVPLFKNNVPGTEDGFGNFSLSLNNEDGFKNSADKVVFTITGSWADSSSVLTANNDGYLAAAHIFPTATNPSWPASSTTTLTGFAANGGVPDGGTTAAMLGSALVGLGLLRRKILS